MDYMNSHMTFWIYLMRKMLIFIWQCSIVSKLTINSQSSRTEMFQRPFKWSLTGNEACGDSPWWQKKGGGAKCRSCAGKHRMFFVVAVSVFILQKHQLPSTQTPNLLYSNHVKKHVEFIQKRFICAQLLCFCADSWLSVPTWYLQSMIVQNSKLIPGLMLKNYFL